MSVKENASLSDFCESDNKENCISYENTIEKSNTVTNMDKNNIGNKRINLDVRDNRNGDIDREITEDGQSNDCLDMNKWNSPSVKLTGKGLIFYNCFHFSSCLLDWLVSEFLHKTGCSTKYLVVNCF